MWEWWRDREKVIKPAEYGDSFESDAPHKDYYNISLSDTPLITVKEEVKNTTSYKPKSSKPQSCTYSEEEMYELVQDKINELELSYVDIKEYLYKNISKEKKSDIDSSFKRIRRDFLKYVAYHNEDECIEAGISEEGMNLLKKGVSPENFNVHLKVPYDFGGANEFDNMILMPTNPIHNNIHKILDYQIYKSFVITYGKIYIPYPEGLVYVSGEVADIIKGGKEENQDKPSNKSFLSAKFSNINKGR